MPNKHNASRTLRAAAKWAIVSCGLFNSVMWPCIFPLAVKGLGKFTSQGSGILIAMVVGGAAVPVLQGFLADKLGYRSENSLSPTRATSKYETLPPTPST